MRDCGYCSFVCLLENEKDGGKRCGAVLQASILAIRTKLNGTHELCWSIKRVALLHFAMK